MRQTYLAAVLALCCVPAVYGQGAAPVGDEFQVNTYIPGWQGQSSVAVLADGGFVVVWESWGSSGSDSSGLSIQGQRYAVDGTAVGEEFQVNTYTDDDQNHPSVAAFPDGGFVVVWHSRGLAPTSIKPFRIQGQRYAADGRAVGAQFPVSAYTPNNQWHSSVATLGDGGFVVVWAADFSGATIQGQRLAADGTAVGGIFQVSTNTSGFGSFPAVSVLADGGFVVVWTNIGSSGSDSSGHSIQGRRYGADGTAVAGEFQINTGTAHDQVNPSVSSFPDGGFVVVWYTEDRSGASRPSIQGQRYAAGGTAVGAELQIRTCTNRGRWTRPTAHRSTSSAATAATTSTGG